jgi:uncharacterized protein (DUF58 family)
MNNRTLLLVLTVCGLALAALGARNGGVLALSIPFLTYILVALLHPASRIRISAFRTIDRTSALAGAPIQVILRITNVGDAIGHLRVQDSLPRGAHVAAGSAQQHLCLASSATADMSYTFTGLRGACAWQTVGAASADPLGLFETMVRIPAPGEVIIRPSSLGNVRLPFRPLRTLHTAGPVPVPLPGSGTDFLDVREYRPGDALRHINWRISARHAGKLFTNEYQRHEAGDYGMILDARHADDRVFEGAISAAASLAEGILGEGNRLSLLVFGKSMAAAFPGYGKRQLSVVLRNLAAATRSPFVSLDYLEYFPRRLFPNRAVLLVISSVFPADSSMYTRLRAAGYEILLVSPDPIHPAAALEKAPAGRQWATRAARVERRAALLSLSKLGIHIVDWQMDQPIQAALQATAPHVVHRRGLSG